MTTKDPLYYRYDVAIPETYQIHIENCQIYGYGATTYAGSYSKYLLTGYVTVITRNECLHTLGAIVAPDYHMGMFCANGISGVDACGGDSGGGLFCKVSDDPTETYLIGFVSYGMGCGSDASVYTSTIHHVDWIKKTINFMEYNEEEE